MLNGRDITVVELAEAISEDLTTRIQYTLDLIHELSSGPEAMAPDDGLKWLQFRQEGGMEFGVVETDEEYHLFWKEVKIKLAEFKPKVTLNRMKKWLKRADLIKNEKDKGSVLEKFWTIDEQFINIEKTLIALAPQM